MAHGQARQRRVNTGGPTVTIEARSISKRFGTYDALRDVTLEVKEGELIALLGPSGSGKTTLLRIIAGLEFADTGRVLFDGEDATDRSARDRRVGFVFQHYALFRHMTVFENVAFGLRVQPRRQRPARAEIAERVHELLRLVQLESLSGRLPSQLSGGQRQRVALARALAVRPRVLLLDEPFGALDSRVRKELRRWLRNLHDELGITSVFVTHDQEEALELADRVVVMDHGRIEQEGTPEQVYHEPATRFVYEFLGDVNIFHARVDRGLARYQDAAYALDDEDVARDAARASIYVRPHLLEIHRERSRPDDLRARIERIHAAGPTVKIELVTEGGPAQAEISQEQYERLELQRGEEVYVRPRQRRVFAEDYTI
jgi:sulfate/thiosulfate transport system ATP-binding protein